MEEVEQGLRGVATFTQVRDQSTKILCIQRFSQVKVQRYLSKNLL